VPRNTKNLKWYGGFESPVTLSGNTHLRIGDKWIFTLEIKKVEFNYIYNIHLFDYFTKNYYGYWKINQYTPYQHKAHLDSQISIYPRFLIDGMANGKRNTFEYRFKPVIITNFHPIFDTRLIRSNDPKDARIVNPIIRFLNYYGFDCSTLDQEVKATNIIGNNLMDSEKEWASQGDCSISILTKRFTDGNIPNWLHAEDAMSYSKGRPRFVFKEQTAIIDASYKQYDEQHILQFNQFNIDEISKQSYKILKFREECQNKQMNNNIKNFGTIALIGFAIVGGKVTLDALLKKSMKKSKKRVKKIKSMTKKRSKQEKI
jgi:hypothetical protein